MKKQLLAMALMGVVLLTFAQSGKKPAKTFKSPRLISVQSNQIDQNPKSLIRQNLSLSTSDALNLRKTVKDDLGFTHQKYQLTYEGYEVFGSEYTAHLKDGKVSHITGNYAKVENVDLQITIPESKALENAKNAIKASKFIWDEDPTKTPEAKMVILDAATTGHEARLTYQFEVTSLKPYQRYDVFIDTKTGEELLKYSKIHFADAVGTAATRYSGSQTIHTDSYTSGYRLRDYTRGNGILTWDATTATSMNDSTEVPEGASDYTDRDNNWTASEFDNADKDNAALETHFGASATYDFFYSTFGRDSYDGSGAAINSYVNVDLVSLYQYPSNDDAWWNGYAMIYGKGTSFDPLTTVDITGHEIGHAFMQHTAGLIYQKESGAIDESFGDIWGACVENFINKNYGLNKDIWSLGSEIGVTIRSMSDPSASYQPQPDTYGGAYWADVTDCSPSNDNDNCEVHLNNGVGNHWFYILTVGKSDTNDNGDSYSVTGIGIDKAAAIAWRSESVYLSSVSDYADWRIYAIQSAVDLYGEGSDEVIAVTNAWYAVGVGSAYEVAYCSSGGDNASYEWIDLVRLGSINNSTSANEGYGDFTSRSTMLVPGSSHTISFSAGFSGFPYSEVWKIWIDYNHDGDFDGSEEIVSRRTTDDNTYSATFTVPDGVSLGSTRMRVSMVYNATPSSCGSFTYGEVEDYTVNISATSPGSPGITLNGAKPGEQLNKLISTPVFMVYPDPVTDVINFTTGDFENVSTARIIDMGGKVVKTIPVAEGRALDISDLKPGLYLFELQTERGPFQTKFIKQ